MAKQGSDMTIYKAMTMTTPGSDMTTPGSDMATPGYDLATT